MNTRIWALVLLVLLGGLPGCGGGDAGPGGDPIVPRVVIVLNETELTLDVGNRFTFIASVRGTANTAVSWSVLEGASGGSITNTGVYTAPGTLGIFHVVATSQRDPTRQALATVTVATLAVSIAPNSDLLGPLGIRLLNAKVNTTLNAKVTWSVQEGAAGGSVTVAGQYTAPKNLGLFHVVATSVQDPSKSAAANLTIVPSGFRPTGGMGTPRSAHTATLLQSGKVLIAGGDPCLFDFYYQDCPVPSAEVYDAGTGSFASVKNMSVSRSFHTATLLGNGKVLVAGGQFASAELYDPASQTFAATGSMSVGRSSHTATLLANGKVLIAGGSSVGAPLATAELYDQVSGTFTTTGTMVASRFSHTATLLANGKVLITGGISSAGAAATAELYDPATGTFSATGSMASQRQSHVATLLSSGNVLVTGGSGANGPLSTAEVYDAVSGSFTATGAMIGPHDSHIAILLTNGTVLVASGQSFTAEIYDPVSGTFTQTGSMEDSRTLPAAVLLQDGRVLVSGGCDALEAELYK